MGAAGHSKHVDALSDPTALNKSHARHQLYRAGASTMIISLKTHLFYLFWLGLILWIWKERRWRVGIGAMVAGLIVAIIPAIFDPGIYQQFLNVY